MLVVSDVDDVFLPKPTDLLVNITEARASLEALLGRLNDMFQENHVIGSALGPALQAGFKLLVSLHHFAFTNFMLRSVTVFRWRKTGGFVVEFAEYWPWCAEEQGGPKDPRNVQGVLETIPLVCYSGSTLLIR